MKKHLKVSCFIVLGFSGTTNMSFSDHIEQSYNAGSFMVQKKTQAVIQAALR